METTPETNGVARSTVGAYAGPLDLLRPIAAAWAQEAHGNEFGLDMDVEAHLADLARMMVDPHALLLVLQREGHPVGYMGIEFFVSPMSRQRIASERYWYVMPQARGRDSLLLLREACEFARALGTSHILFTASRLASELHDSVCRLYEHMGMRPFETIYILPLGNEKGDKYGLL